MLLIISVLLLCGANAQTSDARVKSFMILVTDSNSQSAETSITLMKGGGKATCTFTYQTSPLAEVVPVEPEPTPSKKQVAAQSVFKDLQGQCATHQSDYWTYEVCVGRSVRQFRADDSYMLGNDASFNSKDNVQVYSNGHTCDALPNRPARKTTVRLACQESAKAIRIASIHETSMCVYDLTLATNKVCGDSAYSVINNVDMGPPPALDSGSEDWVMELVELEDGRLMCSAYSLEMRSISSKLTFKKFDLSISTTAQRPPMPTEFTARHPGREPCGSDEVELTNGHLRNANMFSGKLSFVKIYG